MLADIKKEESISAIIVYSYDRFSRSGANGIYLLDNLRKLGVRIISITQEVDSFTPTSNFQENLYMLLSKLDNDMRKDKCVTGTRSILRRGYWPYGTPTGYTNENKGTTADKHVYTINSDGLLLKLAFKWKASGKYTDQEIIDKLSAKGLKVTIRYMAWIFANPFYCGYIYTSLLPGEMIEGKHPPLIDVDTFLQANNISRQNPRSGVSKKYRQEPLPLKNFVSDAKSLSPFTGYHIKAKNLWYYKTRDKGTKVNIAASKMNNLFLDFLSQFQYDRKYKETLKKLLLQKFANYFQDTTVDNKANKKKVTELTTQIEKLEERFVLGEITKEQFDKFSTKYKNDLENLVLQINQSQKSSSNLEKAVEKSLAYAENIVQVWVSSNYINKQQLQYLLFPEGILYDKEMGSVQTNRSNSLFAQIALQAGIVKKNKEEI